MTVETPAVSDVDESLPDDFTPPPGTPTGYACEVCGVELTYGGRGRKPKRCDEHKGRTSTSGTRTSRTKINVDELHDDLLEQAGVLAGLVSQALPVTGVTLGKQADGGIKALLKVAETKPKLLAGIQKAAKLTPTAEIAKVVLAISFAVAVDLQRMNPHAYFPTYLGIAETYDEIQANVEDLAADMATVTPFAPPPFVPVSVA